MISIFTMLLSLLAALSDIIGGALFLHPRFNSLSPRYGIGFASGILVSAAFLELIPSSDIASNSIYVLLGFLVFYVVEKVIMLHSCGEKECESHSVGWISVVGMASDNIFDGIGIAVGFITNPTLGLIITLGVVAHELPQGFTTAQLVRMSGLSLSRTVAILVLAGVMYPIGTLLSTVLPSWAYPIAIAFVAGDFIYIGAGDLLMEAHKKFNIKVVASVISGALIVLLLEAMLGS